MSIVVKNLKTETNMEVAGMRINFENKIEVRFVSGESAVLSVNSILHIGNGSLTYLLDCQEGWYAITFDDHIVYGDWTMAFNYFYTMRSLAYCKE